MKGSRWNCRQCWRENQRKGETSAPSFLSLSRSLALESLGHILIGQFRLESNLFITIKRHRCNAFIMQTDRSSAIKIISHFCWANTNENKQTKTKGALKKTIYHLNYKLKMKPIPGKFTIIIIILYWWTLDKLHVSIWFNESTSTLWQAKKEQKLLFCQKKRRKMHKNYKAAATTTQNLQSEIHTNTKKQPQNIIVFNALSIT